VTEASCFFSVPPGKCRNSILNYTSTASFHILSYSSFSYHPFIRRYIVLLTEQASLNKLQINITHRLAAVVKLYYLKLKSTKKCVVFCCNVVIIATFASVPASGELSRQLKYFLHMQNVVKTDLFTVHTFRFNDMAIDNRTVIVEEVVRRN
jgi:hypothetical protein